MDWTLVQSESSMRLHDTDRPRRTKHDKRIPREGCYHLFPRTIAIQYRYPAVHAN